jgi:hypothetical protein
MQRTAQFPLEPKMTRPLIAPGRTLTFTVADFDAEDSYSFNVTEASQSKLAVRCTMRNGGDDLDLAEGDPVEEAVGELVVKENALERAQGLVNLSQGGFIGITFDTATRERAYDCLEGALDQHALPCLLTRESFAALKEGRAVALQPVWDSPDLDVFEVIESRPVPVTIDGMQTRVPALHVEGRESGVSLTVVDDPIWPLVVSRLECGGDNFWKLDAIQSTPDLPGGD